jgi:2-polyprenyl-6-hydroxyphenyl methylase/3-demethylubiquinone-9 3-methyltransferase
MSTSTIHTAPTLNADPAELARFNALAARWWDEDSEFRPLHRINPHRLAWIESFAPLAGKRVLDVGCGGGILAEAMARRGASVTGIDLAGMALRVAQSHAESSGQSVYYAASSAEEWSLANGAQYDLVTCMEMLEHVPEPRTVIEACANMVKPGGWVVFSTINRNPLSFLMAIVGVEYVLRILPVGTHQYARFIKPSELLAMATAAGLELREQRGLGYNPFTERFRLHGFTGVGYLLAMQKAPATDPASPRN